MKDDGIGIDPQYSQKIFEVFKQLHKKEVYPKKGIWLAICTKNVEGHGGHIWVESELAKVHLLLHFANTSMISKTNF